MYYIRQQCYPHLVAIIAVVVNAAAAVAAFAVAVANVIVASVNWLNATLIVG